MRLPLHLDPNDYSQEACQRRLDLHMDMQQMTGGKGFRQPPSSRKNQKTDKTRLTMLTEMAGHK